MQVRRATMRDIYVMQHCNLRCLPENYNIRYYVYHYLTAPQMLYVNEDANKTTCGYVLGKLDDEDDDKKKHGHITSLAVLRSHRQLGIATKVMQATMHTMQEMYDANYCSLHVRRTNQAAIHLYQDSLGFRCVEQDERYYADDEDAFHMKKNFKGESTGFFIVNGNLVRQSRKGGGDHHPAAAAAASSGGGGPQHSGAEKGGEKHKDDHGGGHGKSKKKKK